MLKWIGSGLIAFLLGTTAISAPAQAAVMFGPGTKAGSAVGAGALMVAANTTGDIVTLQPPAAHPYVWAASKAADGSVSLAGNVPSEDVRDTLVDQVGKLTDDATSLASGEPDNFAADATAAVDILGALDSGKVAFDGTSWSVTGSVDTTDKLKAASTAFDASPLKDAGATYNVNGPGASAAAAAPAADAAAATPAPAVASAQPATSTSGSTAAATTTASPAASAPAAKTPAAAVAPSDYAWTAEKSPDGSFSFSGSVPDAKLKAYLAGHVHGRLTDNSAIADGAPGLFLTDVVSGLNALSALQSGKLSFAKGNWRLSGTAPDAQAEKSAEEAVSQLDTKVWHVDIATAPAPAAAAPAVAPAPATAAPVASATPAPAAPKAAPTAAATPVAAAPAAAAPVQNYVFAATKAAGTPIALSGDVPNAAVKDNFGRIAGDVATSNLVVTANPPDSFVNAALGGIDALDKLESGELGFAGGKWSLKGAAPTPELHDSILASIASLPGGKDWSLEIAGPPPLTVCRAKLAGLAKAGNAVNFVAGTRFAKGAEAALDAIASALALCPDARVDVAGSTDSDGNADVNMGISVARAEAVVAELAKRGIKPSRLYAIGYGETLPLVPNTTKANKAKNRRIDIKVEDVKP